jgi:hypothetical protein
MAETTTKGDELATKLAVDLGYTREVSETCALICRHATTYARIQEAWTSVEMSERQTARVEQQESNIERRIIDLVDSLPETDAGKIKVRFGGDPRGATVLLVMPDGRFDTWGQDGLMVPGS